MVLENATTNPIASTVTNPFSYFLLVIIISFLLFLAIKPLIPKLYAALLSLLLTTLLLELGLTALFNQLQIPISFGTFEVKIPVMGTQTIGNGVMLMRLLDFILNFGLFRGVGVPMVDAFTKTVPATIIEQFPANMTPRALIQSITSSWFNFGVFSYISLDDIIGYIFCFTGFYALLIITSDLFNTDKSNLKIYALILGAIPILAYNYFVSSTISSYITAVTDIEKFSYFMSHADTISIAIFLGTLIISFVVVMELIAIVLSLFAPSGATAFRPSWASDILDIKIQLTSFEYTLAFAITYASNQWQWFVFFPAVALYSLFRNSVSGATDVVKEHESKQEIKGIRQTICQKEHTSGGTGNILIIVLVIATAVAGYLFFNSLGWI